uniref:Uncharacterized protein n=1 Tax=Candidatus Methanophagaceae archaeon ANME-1 ERB6 TaxID=2759912 RepID=A0A7G9YV49_9EURY|nr:hypothetical protein HCMLNGLJ_00003 [Methanosarcinales archaeon ANME-1 ERB6]
MIRVGVSFNGGIRTKDMHKRVKRITSARSKSFGKCLSLGTICTVFILVGYIPSALG